MSTGCLGTDESLKCLLVISCVLGPRSSVCHHQFLIAICTDGHCHRESDDAPSVGDGDMRASVHPGPKRYEALGEGLQDHDEYERKEEALCESRYWETVEES